MRIFGLGENVRYITRIFMTLRNAKFDETKRNENEKIEEGEFFLEILMINDKKLGENRRLAK